MPLDKTAKGHIIIHSFAVAAAVWSGAWALVPVAGPVLADTAGLTAITVAMTYSLARLFGKEIEESGIWTFASVVLGFALGNSLLKAAASLIPVFGSAVNATITLALHEAIGWGLFLIFEEGGDPTRLSKEELKSYVDKGKSKAEKEKENYELMMSKLPLQERQRVEELQKKLGNKNVSVSEKEKIMGEIETIISRYN